MTSSAGVRFSNYAASFFDTDFRGLYDMDIVAKTARIFMILWYDLLESTKNLGSD